MQVDQYSTHIPYLAKALSILGGPVIELGGGFYSSPLIRQFTDKVLTIETDRWWTGTLWNMFDQNTIKYFTSELYYDIEPYLVKSYKIALIDCATIEQRIWTASKLINTDLLVCHGTEEEYWKPVFEQFKYVKHFTLLTPNTSYLSNTIDVETI